MRMAVHTIIVAMIVMIAPGCDSGEKIGKLEKQVEELKAEQKKNEAVVDFDLQSKCSRDAKTYFNENWRLEKDTILLDYTNHYSKKLNKCFIRVVHNYSLSKSFWMSDVVFYDVYENVNYGQITETNTISFAPAYKDEEKITECKVSGTKCTDRDGFNRLSRPYEDE